MIGNRAAARLKAGLQFLRPDWRRAKKLSASHAPVAADEAAGQRSQAPRNEAAPGRFWSARGRAGQRVPNTLVLNQWLTRIRRFQNRAARVAAGRTVKSGEVRLWSHNRRVSRLLVHCSNGMPSPPSRRYDQTSESEYRLP